MSKKITLRRAAKLRNRMMERIRDIATTDLKNCTVNVNVYDPDVITQVDMETQKLNTSFGRFRMLSAALSEVRGQIGKANAANNVDTLLTTQVALLGQRAVLSDIANNVNLRPTDEQITARIAGYVSQAKTGVSRRGGYGNDDVQNISTLTTSMRDDAVNQLHLVNRELDLIQDQLELINANTQIELSDQVLTTITAEKLA